MAINGLTCFWISGIRFQFPKVISGRTLGPEQSPPLTLGTPDHILGKSSKGQEYGLHLRVHILLPKMKQGSEVPFFICSPGDKHYLHYLALKF